MTGRYKFFLPYVYPCVFMLVCTSGPKVCLKWGFPRNLILSQMLATNLAVVFATLVESWGVNWGMNENPFVIHKNAVLKTIPLIPAFLCLKSKRYMRQKGEKKKRKLYQDKRWNSESKLLRVKYIKPTTQSKKRTYKLKGQMRPGIWIKVAESSHKSLVQILKTRWGNLTGHAWRQKFSKIMDP